MLLANRWQRSEQGSAASARTLPTLQSPQLKAASEPPAIQAEWSYSKFFPLGRVPEPGAQPSPEQIDPFYLFLCYLEWEKKNEPTAAWELIAASQSADEDTQAHARALLSRSFRAAPNHSGSASDPDRRRRMYLEDERMRTPYGLEIIENCGECVNRHPGFFCSLSEPVLQSVEEASHPVNLPTGAILFVEGQVPRGIFILCSGKVKLSTTSREGKVLVLKTAETGEVLGLSAAISGQSYELTAETATPCQLKFIDRKSLLHLLHSHSEVGWHAAHSLSRDFQAAYRDIHDLVLSRSSAGKLARLLLSCSPELLPNSSEVRLRSIMTHEEMAQRIGSSRETVTRLLSELKRKKLVRLEGATLVIRNRTALEALAV